VFTEPLPSNDRGIHIKTYGHQGDLISLLLFFKNNETTLKMNNMNTSMVVEMKLMIKEKRGE
jgi:hypothetical protein